MNRTKRLRFVFMIASFLACTAYARAAEATVWVEFENGKRLFKEQEFGQALNSFRGAAQERRRLFEKAARSLSVALETPQGKRAEGSISALIEEFSSQDFLTAERQQIDAEAGSSLRRKIDLLKRRRLTDSFRGFLDALDLTLDYRSFEELNDSLEKLGEAIGALAMYPEAEFWMGRVFQAEGELKLAEIQYQRAWDMREAYEISDERYTALYALADLYRTLGEYQKMEEQYLLVVQNDPTVSDPRNEYLRTAMVNTLIKDGFDKFMSLYRTEYDFAVEAYDSLGSFWYESGRQSKAVLYVSLAVNRVLTKVIDAIRAEEPSYSYRALGELLGRIEGRRDLSDYAQSADLYRLLFTLADALYANGARSSAIGIWKPLSTASSAGPWGTRSAAQLRAPTVKAPTVP